MQRRADGRMATKAATRRDFLTICRRRRSPASAPPARVWPLIDQHEPGRGHARRWRADRDRHLARSQPGQQHHRGVARPADLHRPPHARGDQGSRRTSNVAELRDPDSDVLQQPTTPRTAPLDEARVARLVGICTHLGCIPARPEAGGDRGAASSAAGSARATARTTTLSGRIRQGCRRRSICRCRPTASSATRSIRIGENPPGATFDFNASSRSRTRVMAAPLTERARALDRPSPADLHLHASTSCTTTRRRRT